MVCVGVSRGGIRQGCWREEAVGFRYVDKAGAVTERTIHPLAITYLERKLMVLAQCCLREDFRMFEAGRLSEARLAGSWFRPRRASLLRDYVERLQAGRNGGTGSRSGERRPRTRAAGAA